MSEPPRRAAWGLAAAAFAVGVSRLLGRARVPDDYDSIGFLRALDRFDLAALQPHFPGYPVYVALGRALHSLGLAPLAASSAVSAAAAAATAAALFRIGAAFGGRAAGWASLALYAGASLPWLCGGAALSDGTAVAFCAWAVAVLVGERPRWALSALLVALMLGVRASYWPLAASWAAWLLTDGRRERGAWLAAVAAGALGLAAWGVPLLASVGTRNYLALGRTHLAGHFGQFGGAVSTRPELGARLWAFGRGLFFDGLAPNRLALALLFLLAATGWIGRQPPWKALRSAALLLAPYALWALLGQNVLEQPRHLLPLVVAALVGLALLVADSPLMVVGATLLVGGAALPVVVARVRSEPAAAQAARWVASAFPDGDAAVFGERSVRFFQLYAPLIVTRERTWLSEVDVDLERLDHLPRHILVTSEVEADPRRAPRLSELRRFCRDPRLDRARPCLSVYAYRIGAMP